MAVRWKHGLLRLWSVASVFWIALVWWFNIGYAPTAEYVLTASDGQRYVIYAPEKGAAVYAIEAYLERYKSALPSKGPDPSAQYVQTPQAPTASNEWSKAPLYLGSWENYVVGAKGEPPNPFDQFDPAPPSPQVRLATQAEWAFGPPIATLTFGFIIGWIVLGFRPRKVV